MKAIGIRLRELRETRAVSQDDLGEKLGRNQRWVSGRERGVTDTTVEEATMIADALGYAGEFVILPRERRALLEAVAHAPPEAAAVALRLAEIFPHLDDNVADMLVAMIDRAEQSIASKRAAAP